MSYLYQTPPMTHGLIHANNSLFSLSAVELERMQNGKQYLLNWKTLGLRHLAQMCRSQSVAMSRAFWSPRCAQRAEEADKDTCTHRKHIKFIYIYISAFSRRFYPKRLTVHSGYTFFPVCLYPSHMCLFYSRFSVNIFRIA